MSLDTILETLDIAAEIGEEIGPGIVGVGSAYADKLLKIVMKAHAAHVAITGQPMDLSQLHKIDPLPEVVKP